MSADQPGSVEAWMASAPAEQRTLLQETRALILTSAPEVSEELKWNRPCYLLNGRLVCYLQTAKSHAALGFEQGAQLADPDGWLEGTGKGMRHVKLGGTRTRTPAGLQALVRQAVALRRAEQFPARPAVKRGRPAADR